MGGARVLRRRLSAHPVAVAAIAVSVLASLVVVTALQLLSAAITDAGVRSALDVPAAQRSVVLAGSLRPGALASADAAVAEATRALPDAVVTRVGTATTRGLSGRAATDRAALADVVGLEAAADLVAGQWPVRPSAAAAQGDGRVEVALPESALEALEVGVGDTLELTDLVDPDAPRVTVEVVGAFRPRSADDAVWVDLPLGLSGVAEGDFTTYGPFVVAPGTFDGPLVGASTVTWRATADVARIRSAQVGPLRSAVDSVARDLRRVAGLPVEPGAPETAQPAVVDVTGPRVATDLPGRLAAAALVGDRIRVSLLTPTVLLVLLGAVALVGSAALLATLRDGETRLLRTRGASTGRLAALALGEALGVAALGLAGAALLGPVTSRALLTDDPGAGGLSAGVVEDLGEPVLWRTVAVLAALAVGVTVATTVWVGRDGLGRSASRTRGAGLRLAAGSGLDLVLVALGVLAALQLRRYDASAATTVDPLTTAAPALVVAGLAVLCLRLLPHLARLVSVWGESRLGLGIAWGGWQFARRAASQGGTLLLVLLAVAMGTIALGHSATVDRAIEDQTGFEAGAPVRVVREVAGPGAVGTGGLVEELGGGPDRVTPVWRSTADLGGVDGVTVLGVDAAVAGTVMDPRADTLDAPWPDIAGRLADARSLGGGLELPGTPSTVSVTVRVDTRSPLGEQGFAASVRIRDGGGHVTSLPVGPVSTRERTLTVDLADRGLTPPLALVGLSVPLPDYVYFFVPEPTFDLRVSGVAADGTPVPLDGAFRDDSDRLGLWWSAPPSTADAVPAVVTREVADALDAAAGSAVALPLPVRDLPVRVVAVVDSLPTATVPTRGVLVDLATAEAAPERSGGEAVRSRAVLEPQEWWAAPADPSAAAAAIREAAPYGTRVVVAQEAAAERRADPVNAGMRSAMLLVTLASVVLAAVGFAASTAALGRARRHENAVLLALGMPPGRIRTVLLLERVLVVTVTVLVGLVLGVVAALTVVPLLVGGDGHAQVPPVLVRLPVPALAGYTALLVGSLLLVGALVLRSTSRDLAGELREGEGA